LPSPWPPRLAGFPTSVEKDPETPPYLLSPPSAVTIDVGRQLFIDDFLIAETTLQRTYHLANYHPASPVLKPDRPWEMQDQDHPEGQKDLSSLVGRSVRFRFHLRSGRLYSFWVTPDSSGASHGYVAAGGPGFTGPLDTVGAAAIERKP
jgi:hypothetical protein